MKASIRAVSCAWLALATLLVPCAAAQSPQPVHRTTSLRSELLADVERITRPLAAAAVSVLEERHDYVWEGVQWQLEGRTVFTNEDLYRVEENRYVWDRSASNYAPTSRSTYSGNDFNLVTSNDQWDEGVNGFVPVDRTDYTYAQEGGETLIAEEIYRVWDGASWVDQERTTYTIDDDFTVTGSQTDYRSGAGWEPGDRTEITEESAGVVFLDQQWNGTDWENFQRTTFRYATIKELYAALLQIARESVDFDQLLYALRPIPATEVQQWDGAAWVNYERQENYYDLDGRLVAIEYQEWAEGEWVTPTRFVLEYDNAGMLGVLYLEENVGGGVWVSSLREAYTWNDEGHISSVQTAVDFGEGLALATRQDYFWRNVGSSTPDEEVPAAFALSPAYPNPFNPSTRLDYRIDTSGRVALRVFDTLGREVAALVDAVVPAGTHYAHFEAADLPSGIYLVRLETPGGHTVRSVTLLK